MMRLVGWQVVRWCVDLFRYSEHIWHVDRQNFRNIYICIFCK